MNTFVFLLAAIAVLGPSGEKVCDVTLPALPQDARIETTNLENAVAWRIRFDGEGERRMAGEGWVFDFGRDIKCWPVSHAQGEYVPKTLSTISQMRPRPDFAPVAAGIGEMHNYATHFPGTAESPLVVEGPGFVAAIGDAGCLDYARIRFASGERPGTVKTVLEGEAVVKAPYATPWRYIHVAKDAVSLANAQPALMDALNAPSRIADTSWIKPGKVLRVAKLDTDCGKAAVDFVKRNGMQYIELDCGWYGQEHTGDPLKPGLAPERVAKGEKFDFFEILRYAKEKDVGVILYVNREPLKKNRDAILDKLVEWGVKGVKYGFVNVGSQKWRRWVTDAIAAAAERKLLVDIHDEYRLTGVQKTYPNVMTVEGICGNEEMPNAAHDCALPFTRFLDGPGDYTPCWNNGRVKNTLAHQLALPCVYTSGWQFLFWYSRPDQIPEKDPALDFWRELPASFDETRFLQGEIGKFAVVARRKGRTWYVAGINGLERRAFTMDTSFLGAGEWKCRLFRDDDPAIESGLGKVTVESVPVAPTMTIPAAARGGFAAIFEPSREAWRGADVMNRAVQFPLDAVSLDGGPLKERQDVDTSYLLDVVDADRLLAEFRRIAGLPAKAVRYPNRWEGGQINGHSLGHYLSSVSALCAVASDPDIRRRAKAKVDYVVSELAACQKANGDGYLMTCPKEIYDKVRSGDFTAGGFDINKWWVPNYTLHKVMAGLRDACRCAKNRTALEVERKLADWYIGVVADLSDADIQRLLISEWGGLNETFANLYDDTGDVKYRDAAERFFDDRRIFDPLKRGEDRLDGRHANTQVPKMAGLARLYEQTGKPEYRTAVETFWKSVVLERSFVTGGHSDNEHFHPVRDNVKRLGPHNGETCNVNNMLRLTAHVFGWEPRSSQMDFVECALYNHLAAQIGRNPGEFGYFLSLAPVAEKVWSTPEGAWWCCVGTGMENPMHYAEHAYYRSADEETLYVNLFMPTTLTWAEKGVKVVQTTQFPRSDEVLLEISSASPVRFTLKIRRPAWIGKDGVVFGELPGGEDPVPEDDGYYTISREWRDGDKIRFRLPMELRKVPLPHSDGRRIAFARGPLVMAGIMPPEKGKRDLAKERWDDHLAAPGRTDEASMVLMEGDGIYLRPHGLEFMPLMDVYEEHYTVYFPVMSEAEWAREAKRLEEERVRAAELAARLVDEVWPGFQQSEVNHDIVHEHSSTGDAHGLKYRHGEGPDALFGYTLAVDDAEACELVVRYWGGDLGRVFDIAVDGTVLCRETIDAPAPGRVFEKSYPLPLEVTRGKKKISVAFKGCEKTHFTAGVYHVAVRRMKMADKEKFEAAETLSSPDGRLSVAVGCSGGAASYAVYLEGAEVISPSPLGIVADFADLSRGLAVERAERDAVDEEYSVPTLKSGRVRVTANRMKMFFTNSVGRCAVAFHVSDRDVAFRYEIPAQCGRRSVRVLCEKTGFSFPDGTTGFMSPQARAMTGWRRSKPSYEEEYVVDAALPAKSAYGCGWTFPALFREGGTWVLLGETGTDSGYCACRLGEFDGCRTGIEFPMPDENNGNGTIEPAFALPGATPWRTITAGGLKDVVETTIAWDLVNDRLAPLGDRKFDLSSTRNAWSWILWQDESMNAADQKAYVDFAADMGWEGVLIDEFWDRDIGREGMEKLAKYAASKNVGLWLWYSSSGWWNDIAQSPVNVMCDPIARKRDMKWMRSIGIKGIKVDFWGGDKQETMRLYEQVLADAYEYGLRVVFHGCTIPRGWERMYPNFAGAEAVLASENRFYNPHFCKTAGVNASLHPFVRNSLASMEYGGTFLNAHMSRDNAMRHERGTTVAFELATAVLFQCPVQNFALAPNNLSDAPRDAIEFMKGIPTLWDETRFLGGYPGKYVAIARRSGAKWYVAAVAGEKSHFSVDLSFCGGDEIEIDLAANDGWCRILPVR